MKSAPLGDFAAWLKRTGMTGAEQAECLRLARRGFGQPADLLLLGEPGEEVLLLRALGGKQLRGGGPWQLGDWRLWPCPAGGERRECLVRFFQSGAAPGRKKLLLLFAASGRGGRLRAQRLWRRACAGAALPSEKVPVLAVQILRANRPRPRRFCRQENSEWRLQQAAECCLGRQVTVFTVGAGHRAGCGRERLWYHLAKNLV